jgi:hypothetical protein
MERRSGVLDTFFDPFIENLSSRPESRMRPTNRLATNPLEDMLVVCVQVVVISLVCNSIKPFKILPLHVLAIEQSKLMVAESDSVFCIRSNYQPTSKRLQQSVIETEKLANHRPTFEPSTGIQTINRNTNLESDIFSDKLLFL